MSNYDDRDPTFTKDGNAAVGQFYSSGGKNDSTGREPFEDSISQGHHHTSQRTTGESMVGQQLGSGQHAGHQSTGAGIASGLTGDHSGHSHAGHSHGHHGQREEIATEQSKGRGMVGSDGMQVGGQSLDSHVHSDTCGHNQSQYGSNTAAQQYESSTSGVGQHGQHGQHGLTGDHNRTTGTSGLTGDRVQGGGLTGDSHAGEYSGEQYGKAIGDKAQTNQNATRHGDDFTGGFSATGGAYTNPHKATGLTGRETTTTGVQDQHGDDTQKMGLMDKVKNAIGGHKNDANANHNQ